MIKNIFQNIADSDEEIFENLLEDKDVRIERIISSGQSSPEDFWYDQSEDEWVLLLRGAAELEFESETIKLAPGEYLLIPAHKRHRVKSTAKNEKTIWLAIFLNKGD